MGSSQMREALEPWAVVEARAKCSWARRLPEVAVAGKKVGTLGNNSVSSSGGS